MAYANSWDAGLTAEEEIEGILKGTLDLLHSEINARFHCLNEADKRFGFLLDVEILCYGPKQHDLQKKCENVGSVYWEDIDGDQLCAVIMDCHTLLSTRATVRVKNPEELLTFIVQYGDEVAFPNLWNAVQIMLTIAVSIASCERSFSKLKLIFSYLRATMVHGSA